MNSYLTTFVHPNRLTAALRPNDGGALVELAAVIALMATLLAGAAEFAMLAYDSIEVSDAARVGASYAAQSATTANNTAIIRNVAAASANDISGLTTTSTVFYSCSSTPSVHSSSSPPSPPCASSDTILTYIQISTSATVTMPIHLPGLTNYELTGQAVMRVQ